MTFNFGFDNGRQMEANRWRENSIAQQNREQELERESKRSQLEFDSENAKRGVDNANIELARRKAQQKLDNFNSGVVSAKDKEQEMSDFERKKQSGDYDLDNQIKAWGSANQYRMAEADQSNVAQKDRLGMQLGTQKEMQQAQIGQENRLRRDDFDRAVQGFKLNI